MPTPARRAMSSRGALAPSSMRASRVASSSRSRLRSASARIRRCGTELVASASGGTGPPVYGGLSSASLRAGKHRTGEYASACLEACAARPRDTFPLGTRDWAQRYGLRQDDGLATLTGGGGGEGG